MLCNNSDEVAKPSLSKHEGDIKANNACAGRCKQNCDDLRLGFGSELGGVTGISIADDLPNNDNGVAGSL